MTERLKIAWFSPTMHSGDCSSISAYVSEELVPILSKEHDLHVYHDSFLPYAKFKTGHYLKAFLDHRQTNFDIFFYQIENQRSSDFTRMALGLEPGIVYFHDFLFTNKGPISLEDVDWPEKYSALNATPPQNFDKKSPLGLREGHLANQALFSSARCNDEYLRNVPRPSSYFLPVPVDCGAFWPRTIAWHGEICFCGSAQIEDRPHLLLSALKRQKSVCHLTWLIDSQEESHAQDLIREYEVSNITLIKGRSLSKWREIVKQANIAVHTHFSVFGNIMPYLEMSLAAGLPSILTDFAEAYYVPSEIVYKICPGIHEAEELHETISMLLSNQTPPSADAALYARENFERNNVAKQLSYLLKHSAKRLAESKQSWESFLGERTRALLDSILLENDPLIRPNLANAFKEYGWL